MAKQLNCIICGSCVLDMICRPVDLSKPIGSGELHEVDAAALTGGGITINSGTTMARLGVSVGVLSYVGDDAWGPVVRSLCHAEGIDDELLTVHPTGATSTTVVMVDQSGERSFFHCVGAPQLLDAKALVDRLDVFENTTYFLMGYYSLMPNLESDLPDVFRRIRQTGCKTAMDAAGRGGTMKPLDAILPHLDVYVPSRNEATNQTGHDDPQKIIEAYRNCGAAGLLGVKLGGDGVMLSPQPGSFMHIPVIEPPDPVTDTTGAGDSFFGGLLAGLIKGLSIEDAGKLGNAAAACCCTSPGGSTGGRDYPFTAKLAGIAG